MFLHRRPTPKQKSEVQSTMSRIQSNRFLSDCFNTRSRLFSKFKRWLATRYGLLAIVALLVVFINEVLFYELARLKWPDIDHIAQKPNVEKLLLVADPQLIGEKDEGFFGMITRIDADRYLAKTFAQASAHVQPNWILFLGDIFDEGLSANDDEFKRYFNRFDTIFHYEGREQRCIVIPGDNDVGGEYYGDKQPILRQRFRNYFGRTIALYRQNNIEFLKLDIDMIESYTDGKRYPIMEQTQNRPMTYPFRIVLNHWPILTRSASFVKPFIDELDPNLILKGDSHHFYIFEYDRANATSRLIAREYMPIPILPLNLNQKRYIYEISVPTCSYRMGVERIGYGVLLLDSATKTAHLVVLTTPKRYISLYLYAAYGVFFALVLIITALFPRRTIIRLLLLFR